MSAADAVGWIIERNTASNREVDALIGAMADIDWAVRKSATNALAFAASAHDKALPALLSRTYDCDWRVRKAALDVLAGAYRVGMESAVMTAVVTRLVDEMEILRVLERAGEFDERAPCDRDVKHAAIMCLCKLSVHGQQVGPLLHMMYLGSIPRHTKPWPDQMLFVVAL